MSRSSLLREQEELRERLAAIEQQLHTQANAQANAPQQTNSRRNVQLEVQSTEDGDRTWVMDKGQEYNQPRNLETVTDIPGTEDDAKEREERQMSSLASIIENELPRAGSDEHHINNGLRNAVAAYRFDGEQAADLAMYMAKQLNEYKDALLYELHSKRGIKFTLAVQVEIDKRGDVDDAAESLAPVTARVRRNRASSGTQQSPKLFSRMYEITNPGQIQAVLLQALDRVESKLTKWTNDGSGWNLRAVLASFLNIFEYKPLRGSSYVDLPKDLKAKHAIVNVKNQGTRCFEYSILAALHPPQRDAQRVSKYTRYLGELNFDGIPFPVALRDVPKFERLNNISVNVYTYETITSSNKKRKHSEMLGSDSYSEVLPLYISNYRPLMPVSTIPGEVEGDSTDRHVDLLSFGGNDTSLFQQHSHYAWIKDFDRLMCNSGSCQRTWHCKRCLHRFWVREKYEDHIERDCKDFTAVKVKLPPPHKAMLEFDQYHKQLPTPFFIVFHIQSLLEKVVSSKPSSPNGTEQQSNKVLPGVGKVHKHTPCGYAFTTICTYDKRHSRPIKVVRAKGGEDIMRLFLDDLMTESDRIKSIVAKNHKMIFTAENKESFQREQQCHICKQPLRSRDEAVRDHCHLTGKYRGAAHSECNIAYHYKHWKIPVIAHNLKGYDSHFIIRALHKGVKRIHCIPSNTERYMSFEFAGLRFVDSMNFLNTSLGQLTEMLLKSKGPAAFPQTRALVEQRANTARAASALPDELHLLLRKGVYPAEYMDSYSRFQETVLPSRVHFFSVLDNEEVTDEDYEHALKVFHVFDMRNLGEYHDLFLQRQVTLLADVFESFRRLCLEKDGLDPTHYISLPGFTMDNLLKRRKDQGMSAVSLFHEHQLDMYLFMEKAIRGGVCMVPNRHAEANNQYMELYNSAQPGSFIWFLDCNGLYAWAMCQPLPIADFQWLDSSIATTWTSDRVMALDPQGTTGYVLEVDLDYPAELHDLHNDYALAPEKRVVLEAELSTYSKQTKQRLNGLADAPTKDMEGCSQTTQTPKLICSLQPKVNYTVHYRTLQLYLRLGLKLSKVHRVLSFRQEAWMKEYVDHNATQRAAATNIFDRDFYKMKINANFGKTMENVRKRIEYEPVTTAERLIKLVAKPNFKRGTFFSKEGVDDDVHDDRAIGRSSEQVDVIGVELYKTSVRLDKPIHTGFAILDLSKLLMYDFHYHTIKAKYGERAKLLYTDTDSLMYHIQTEDLYADIRDDATPYPLVGGANLRPGGETLLQKLDCSAYADTHMLYDQHNKKVVGKFKDESPDCIITEFVGLRAKMYSYTSEPIRAPPVVSGGNEADHTLEDDVTSQVFEHKRAAGLKKSVVENSIRHQQYLDCLMGHNSDPHKVSVTSVQSRRHQVSTVTASRCGLSACDDKRFQLDACSTLAYGHCRIPAMPTTGKNSKQ